MSHSQKPRVLAIASGGCHWSQLMRLRTAFEGADVHFASTDRQLAAEVAPAPLHVFPDASGASLPRMIAMAAKLLWIILRIRPTVVVSTGDAGGYLAIRIAQAFGARGMFIDSVANARALSTYGQMSLGRADRTLSQWPAVAAQTGAEFHEAVL